MNYLRMRGKLRKEIVPIVERHNDGITEQEVADCLLSQFNIHYDAPDWRKLIGTMLRKTALDGKIQEFEIRSSDAPEDICIVYLGNEVPWPAWLKEIKDQDWCI